MGYWKQRLLRLWHDEGGFIQFLPLIASALGSVFGGAAGGKSDQRMQENQLLAQQNNTLANLFNTQQNAQMQAGNLDLNRKSFTEQARGGRAKQAVLADILSNLKPTNVSVPGIKSAQMSGGLNANAIGDTGRASLAELAHQAMQAQLAGRDGEAFSGGQLLQAPQLAQMKQASGLEKFLNMAGLVGSAIGAVGHSLPSGGSSFSAPSVQGFAGAPAGLESVGATNVLPQGLTPDLLQALNYNPNIYKGVQF